MHDKLTNLPNRALFLDRLEHCLSARERKPDVSSAVLFLDLDRFKYVNDSLGHHCGDILLQQASERLLECVRKTDTVARFGGDEFAVLLEDMKQTGIVISISERILAALETPFDLEGKQADVSCSIGAVLLNEGYQDPDKVLQDVDAAMYAAKAEGKPLFIYVYDSI